MRRFLLALTLIELLTGAPIALAEETPNTGNFDPRVRIVDYNANEVIRLNTYYGVSTHIQLGSGEKVTAIAAGDDKAWQIVNRDNHIFIKPKEVNADTNVTVVTDKRVYQFILIVQPHNQRDAKAWSDPNLIYSLSFRYPDEELSLRQQKAKADQVKATMADMKARLAHAANEGGNTNYWVAGSPEISPTAARDDGRFIYLTFSNNRDMPALFGVDVAGNEFALTPDVQGNTMVVPRLLPTLMLRKGSAVAKVVNQSFDLDAGTDNTSGTIAPSVERVIREVR
jgi:type IV secretion system protein VirB9